MARSLKVDSFDDFKTVVNTQSLRAKWVEIGSYYYLRAFDNYFEIEYELEKVSPASSEQTDFETNYKNVWVLPNVVRSVVTFGNNEWPELTGFSFTATASSNTSHEFKFLKAYQLQGASGYFENGVVGDYIELEVNDKDNVLGAGAGYVLHKYAETLHIIPNTYFEFKDVDLAALPAANLYCKVTYHSTGGVNVKGILNFYTYILK